MEPFGHLEAARMRAQEVARLASSPERLMRHELGLSRSATRSPAPVKRRIRLRRPVWSLRPAPCC